MISIESIKQILIKEKVIITSKKEANKLIFNSNIYRVYKIYPADWDKCINILINKYPELQFYLEEFPQSRQLVDALNNNYNEAPKCPYCGKPLLYRSEAKINERYCKTCGDPECIQKSIVNTSLKNFGVKHPTKSQEVQSKRRKTTFEKYGVEEILASKNIRKKIEETNKKNHGGIWNNQLESDKIKRAETNRRNHGGLLECQTEEGKEKRRKTNLEKYGYENTLLVPEFIEKGKQTCLEKYGVENATSSEIIKEKILKTNLEKFGVTSYTKTKEYKEKSKKTNLERYGVPFVSQCETIQNKMKKTCLEKYGVPYVGSSKIFIDKFKKTFREKYGVENPSQVKEFQDKKVHKYYYDNLYFDSSYELAYYYYLKSNDFNFIYHPNPIKYLDSTGKSHMYYPDFLVEDKLIEIKGDHLIDKNNKLIDFYNNKIDDLLESKEKCMKDNGVIIIKYENIKNIIKDIKITEGSKFFEQCKLI